MLKLTKREQQIYDEYAKGQDMRTIANKLFITYSTVRSHVATIFKKRNIHSQVELMKLKINELENEIKLLKGEKYKI